MVKEISLKPIVYGPTRQSFRTATNALRAFADLISREAGGVKVPQLCLVEAPPVLGSQEGWRQIASDVAFSGMDDAHRASSALLNFPPKIILEGTVASVLQTRTRADEGRNITAVICYSPYEMENLTENEALIYFIHECQHACRLGLENVPHHRHEAKADTFALLTAAGRLPLIALDSHVARTTANSNPLTGNMGRASASLAEPLVYPIAYTWNFVRPLAAEIEAAGSPLTLADAMRITDNLWDRVLVPSGLDEAAYQAAKQICIAKEAYDLGTAGVSRALATPHLHPVMRAVLEEYAKYADPADRTNGTPPERLFGLYKHDRTVWNVAELAVKRMAETLRMSLGRTQEDEEPSADYISIRV